MIGTLSKGIAKLLFVASIGLLIGCSRQPDHSAQAKADLKETHELIAAVKQNPSVQDPSKAGPPIHVDPYVHSAGMGRSPQAPDEKPHH